MKALRMRNVLVAIAVLTLAILLALPSTGWVLRTQLRMLVSTFPEKALLLLLGVEPEKVGLTNSEGEKIRAIVKQRLHQVTQLQPDDEEMQIALSVLTEPLDMLPDRLRDLLKRFPNSPPLHAAILRYDFINRVRLDRKERYLISDSPLPEAFLRSEPQHLAAFEQVAIRGEKIDPENAFFPMMQAVALFAAHRDHEALKALMRASEKKRWDDYGLDEREGVFRLWESIFGKPSGLMKICLLGFWLEAYLGTMRPLSYIATYKAIELERKGRLLEGLKIRLALMGCGRLMREQGKSKMSRTIGTTITHIATIRPKGEPIPPPKRPEEAEERGKSIQVRFINYLRQIGQSETAKWVQGELQEGWRLRKELHEKVQRSPFLDELAFAWSLGLTFLSAIAILLAMWTGAEFCSALND